MVPDDLLDFLQRGQQLKYDPKDCEAGSVILKRSSDLVIAEIYIDSENSPWQESDPNAGREGYYSIPAVSLVDSCEGYDPEGILVWLPDQQCYGTWDNDHWDVLVFPDVSWSDIVANPVPFINAQWRGEVKFEYLRPWPCYEFKQGRPW